MLGVLLALLTRVLLPDLPRTAQRPPVPACAMVDGGIRVTRVDGGTRVLHECPGVIQHEFGQEVEAACGIGRYLQHNLGLPLAAQADACDTPGRYGGRPLQEHEVQGVL